MSGQDLSTWHPTSLLSKLMILVYTNLHDYHCIYDCSSFQKFFNSRKNTKITFFEHVDDREYFPRFSFSVFFLRERFIILSWYDLSNFSRVYKKYSFWMFFIYRAFVFYRTVSHRKASPFRFFAIWTGLINNYRPNSMLWVKWSLAPPPNDSEWFRHQNMHHQSIK